MLTRRFAFEQIAADNLDFSVQYDAEDELGTLCKSFERMKNELLNNYKRIWRMTEERRKLNAAFAHDLRIPLTVLQGYTDFLEEYIPFVINAFRIFLNLVIVPDISFEILFYIIPVNLTFALETDIINQDQLFTVRIDYDIYIPVFNHLFCFLSSFPLICRH